MRKHYRHVFLFIRQGSGCNKRLRAALPQIKRVKRSQVAGWGNDGYCESHSRFFWGLRLYLVCTPVRMPVLWALADPKLGEREVLAAMPEVDAALVRERPGLLLIIRTDSPRPIGGVRRYAYACGGLFPSRPFPQLGLRPRPRTGASPLPAAWICGPILVLREGAGRGKCRHAAPPRRPPDTP